MEPDTNPSPTSDAPQSAAAVGQDTTTSTQVKTSTNLKWILVAVGIVILIGILLGLALLSNLGFFGVSSQSEQGSSTSTLTQSTSSATSLPTSFATSSSSTTSKVPSSSITSSSANSNLGVGGQAVTAADLAVKGNYDCYELSIPILNGLQRGYSPNPELENIIKNQISGIGDYNQLLKDLKICGDNIGSSEYVLDYLHLNEIGTKFPCWSCDAEPGDIEFSVYEQSDPEVVITKGIEEYITNLEPTPVTTNPYGVDIHIFTYTFDSPAFSEDYKAAVIVGEEYAYKIEINVSNYISRVERNNRNKYLDAIIANIKLN